jgi:3-deoxy-7-phosphoheptulonate synthase
MEQRSTVVDCSPTNSGYDPDRRATVGRSVMAQRRSKEGAAAALVGLMPADKHYAGKQTLPADPGARVGLLRYGMSVTDACMDWTATVALLDEAHSCLA